MIAQYGGDEFVLLLPDTDEEAARMIAERILTSLRARTTDGVSPPAASGASGGLDIPISILLAPADRNLYASRSRTLTPTPNMVKRAPRTNI